MFYTLEFSVSTRSCYLSNSNIFLKLFVGKSPEVITLHFTSFSTECTYDYIHIHDGNSSQSPLLATISGTHTDITLSSTGSQVRNFVTSCFVLSQPCNVRNPMSKMTCREKIA